MRSHILVASLLSTTVGCNLLDYSASGIGVLDQSLLTYPLDSEADGKALVDLPQPKMLETEFPSLLDITLDQLQEYLGSFSVSSVDLVKAYQARNEDVKSLNVVTEFNPDALIIAEEFDDERKKGIIRGPLHGVPILIKNNIATKDQMNNTAGSWGLVGAKISRESTIASKLRAAGAIILGKANLSQWANYRSKNSNSGWSAYGGQVYGPYHENQDPSGSSSGSGVASAIGLAFAAIGTETDGSIVSPANCNNIVGIKPTVGLTSRIAVIPISEHQDSIGPMARTVKDAAVILQAIAGIDPADNYTLAIPNGGKLPNYVAACKPDGLKGARIGVARNVIQLGMSENQKPETIAFDNAIKTMEAAGATVVDANFPDAKEAFDNSDRSEDAVLQADILVNLPAYLKLLTVNPHNITDLASLREFTRNSSLEAYPDRDTAIWDDVLDVQKWNNTDPRFWEAYQKSLHSGQEGGLLGALEREKVDAVILPTSIASSFAARVGAPIITVPLGFYPTDAPVKNNSRGNLVDTGPNIPFGISFLGAKWSEETLIRLAYAFEQKTNARMLVKPQVVPKTELKDIVKSS